MHRYDIVKLDPRDYSKCNHIWDMSKQKHTDKWYHELVDGNRIIFVALLDGLFIADGALVLEKNDSDYTIPHRRVYLSRLNVKLEYRNQGIGGTMIDFLADYAKGLGFTEMSVGVDLDNDSAQHLYQKKGFSRTLFEGQDEQGKYKKLLKTL